MSATPPAQSSVPQPRCVRLLRVVVGASSPLFSMCATFALECRRCYIPLGEEEEAANAAALCVTLPRCATVVCDECRDLCALDLFSSFHVLCGSVTFYFPVFPAPSLHLRDSTCATLQCLDRERRNVLACRRCALVHYKNAPRIG